jgi:PKD repeat protein
VCENFKPLTDPLNSILKERGILVKGKKLESMLLVTLLVLCTMAIIGTTEVKASFPSDQPSVWVGNYKFFNAANLTSTNFNVTVNIFNVTSMKGCNIKLGYNASLIQALRAYPTAITASATKWLPINSSGYFNFNKNPVINNTRVDTATGLEYVWISAWAFTPFTGSGSLFTIMFQIIEAPPRHTVTVPTNASVSCILHLFGTEILDPSANEISHYDDDGLYSYSRPQILVTPPVAAFTWTPTYPSANQTVNFNASASTPNGGSIVSYAWNFSGVLQQYGVPTTTWKFNAIGNYIVTLNVTNSVGLWNTVSHVVQVRPSTTLFVDPPVSTVAIGQTFKIGIIINSVTNLSSFGFKLSYNAAILQAINVWVMWPDFYAINQTAGVIWVNASCPYPYPFSGSGAVAAITFTAVKPGICLLHLYNTTLIDFHGMPIANVAVDGSVTVTLIDVAVVNIASSVREVYQGNPVTVTVTAINNGTQQETFWVALYYNQTANGWTLIGNQTITNLLAGAEKTLTFVWNTTNAPVIRINSKYGSYTFKATAEILPNEVNIKNNVLVGGVVGLRLLGDVNGDGMVTLADVGLLDLIFSEVYPYTCPPYNAKNMSTYYYLINPVTGKVGHLMPDINGDGILTLADVGKLDLIYSSIV